MNIYGKFIVLRAMQQADMEMIVEMFNSPEIESLVQGWTFPMSLEQQNKWFERNINDQSDFHFVIECPNEGAVGIATLKDIDWKNRRAGQGIKIRSSKYRARGIGTDTVMAIMRYAFDELGLHRLDSGRFEDNIASRKLYEKCGWHTEGRRREYIYKNGSWRDWVYMGILESEYRKLIEETRYWSGEKNYHD